MAIPPILLKNGNWEERRVQLLALFGRYVYGFTPDFMPDFTVCRQLERLELVDGFVRETYVLYFRKDTHICSLRFAVYLPPIQVDKLPSVLVINPFDRNFDVQHSAARTYGHLPYAHIGSHGYASIYIYADDLCLDNAHCFQQGLLQMAPSEGKSGWGAIGVWAWGVSRVIDWLWTQRKFDQKRVALAGCSRAGKTALWCAAQDVRVSLVISNVSGCTGAALTRDKQGERIRDITSRFPHWMCKKYAEFADRENELPVDQHMLLALCAPRPIYVSSASEDDWADPHQEFASCVLAGEVYRYLGKGGLSSERMPSLDLPVYGDGIAYHIRTGVHGCQIEDWNLYLPFIARNFNYI